MRSRCLTFLALCSTAAFTQTMRFTRHEISDLGKQRITGAAVNRQRLVTWGDRILTWDLPGGRMQPVHARLPRPPGPGGAMLDIDGDREPDLIVDLYASLNYGVGRSQPAVRGP